MSFVEDLDTPLLQLSNREDFTLRDACSHVHIFGASGSGKTTGSGRMLAGAYLRAGMGGTVTIVKPDDIPLWKRYAKEHGRDASLVLFDENEGYNFLTHEISRQGMEGIGTVTECLMRVLEAARKASPMASQRGGEVFWADATRQVLRYALPLLYAANGTLSIGDLIRFITAAPAQMKDVTDPEWKKRSFMYQVLEAAVNAPKVPMAPAALSDAISYWAEQYPAIPERTKGNIVITATTTLDRFKHGRLNRAFCQKTTIVPEMTLQGSVIVLAMPTVTWAEDGVIGQMLFKEMWQRTVLGRNALAENHRKRPVFLISDEAQETVSSYDGEFLSMCRSSKCCVVYLTQSLPSYYAKMGGDNPRDAAHALVGKFTTHIYHTNACPDTNEYASRVIGKVTVQRANYSRGTSKSTTVGMSAGWSESSGFSSNHGHSFSSQHGGGSGSSFTSGSGHNSGSGSHWGSNRGRGISESVTRGYSESMENAIEPGDFARVLKNGGRANRNTVTGIWFQGGRIFKGGANFQLEAFRQ